MPFQRGLSSGPRRPCGRFMRREAPAKPATCGPHQRERASGDCMCTRGKSDHTHPGPPGGRPLLTQTPEDFPSASFREGWEEGFSLWDGQSRCSLTWATGRSSAARLRVPPQVAAGGTRARRAGLAFLVLVISPTTCRGVPSTFHRPNAFKEAETFRSRSIFGQRDEKMGRIEAASQEAKSLKQPLTELSTPSMRPGRPRRDGRPPPGCVPDSATKSARGRGRGDGEAGCPGSQATANSLHKKAQQELKCRRMPSWCPGRICHGLCRAQGAAAGGGRAQSLRE